MSRTARPLGTPLRAVALLAVLAVTVGWTLPPERPGTGDAGLGATSLLHSRVAGATALRAALRDAAWDARAAVPRVRPAEGRESVARPQRFVADFLHRPAPPPQAAPDTKPRAKTTRAAYQGTNHFWFPAIGISRPVVPFPCERKRPPDDYLYRWGCAKKNNVYLLGHARSVMKPLHDAYVSGRLKVGMLAVYADGQGRVRTYRVAEWRVVDPAEGVHWAIAAQPVPSMTLQTCVGKDDRWRLNVRLVAID